MTATAMQFQPMLSSVLESQDGEITIGKQPILADYGREVRLALNALPPDVSRDLMAEYREPSQELVSAMENAITFRELAIENATQEINLDQEWLSSGAGNNRKISESTLSSDDEWNNSPSM
jgi:hypothetical protein